jgi:hypothetical protein
MPCSNARGESLWSFI